MNSKVISRKKRQIRIRKKVQGTAERPRLAVQRTLKNFHVQIVNDTEGKVITGATTASKSFKQGKPYGGNIDSSKELAKICAGKLKEAGITKVVFDRGGNLYHGRVKALADGLREEGIEF